MIYSKYDTKKFPDNDAIISLIKKSRLIKNSGDQS